MIFYLDGDGFNTANWHVAEHYIEYIQMFGMPLEWSGQRGESKLADFKKWVKSMNFHNTPK